MRKSIIITYKRTLNLISKGQATQFHKEMVDGISPDVPDISDLIDPFGVYSLDASTLDAAYKLSLKSERTQEVVKADSNRDGTTNFLIASITFHKKYPQNENEAERANHLNFLVDKYLNSAREEYKAETSAVRGLVNDLKANPNDLTLFGLTALTNRLEAENNLFEQIYLVRSEEKDVKHNLGTLTGLALKSLESFDELVRVLDAVALISKDAGVRLKINKIAAFINKQINDYTTIYHRHAGITKSGESDVQRPDVSLPSPPSPGYE